MRKTILICVILITLILSGCHSQPSQPANNPGSTSTDNNQTITKKDSPESTNDPGKADMEGEQKTDSGTYNGRADNNFIEVKISGVPEPMGIKVFMLSEDLKKNFDNLNLKETEQIKFKYHVNNQGQSVIFEITKL